MRYAIVDIGTHSIKFIECTYTKSEGFIIHNIILKKYKLEDYVDTINYTICDFEFDKLILFPNKKDTNLELSVSVFNKKDINLQSETFMYDDTLHFSESCVMETKSYVSVLNCKYTMDNFMELREILDSIEEEYELMCYQQSLCSFNTMQPHLVIEYSLSGIQLLVVYGYTILKYENYNMYSTNDINDIIISEGYDEKDAEKLKLKSNLHDLTRFKSMLPYLNTISNAISEFKLDFRKEFNVNIETFTLIGGGANLKGLIKYFENQLTMYHVSYFDNIGLPSSIKNSIVPSLLTVKYIEDGYEGLTISSKEIFNEVTKTEKVANATISIAKLVTVLVVAMLGFLVFTIYRNNTRVENYDRLAIENQTKDYARRFTNYKEVSNKIYSIDTANNILVNIDQKEFSKFEIIGFAKNQKNLDKYVAKLLDYFEVEDYSLDDKETDNGYQFIIKLKV